MANSPLIPGSNAGKLVMPRSDGSAVRSSGLVIPEGSDSEGKILLPSQAGAAETSGLVMPAKKLVLPSESDGADFSTIAEPPVRF